MKGLIYKDFCLSRKKLFLATILYFYVMIFGILFRLSMIYGNLSLLINNKIAFSLLDMSIYYGSIYSPLLFLFSVNTEFTYCICDDYKVKWNTFSTSLPIKKSDIIISRYLIIIINTLIIFIFSTINAVIINHLSNRNFSLDIIKNFLIISIFCFLVSVLYMILAYKYRQRNIVEFIFVVSFFVFTGTFLIFQNNYKYNPKFINERFSEIRDAILPFSIFILLFISFLGYIISLNILKRGEN